MGPADLPFLASLATIDVSFIGLTKVLPAVATCLAPGGEVLAMVKPQFELEKGRVGRGVVHDPAARQEAVLKVALAARELGLPARGVASSGLPGPKGNRETFVWCGGDGPALEDLEGAIAAADAADPDDRAAPRAPTAVSSQKSSDSAEKCELDGGGGG
jgi:23S rRNA (cytidine1920-2'-O)/16S rRNA (cytidine1409-2'-O)-methyltransferase